MAADYTPVYHPSRPGESSDPDITRTAGLDQASAISSGGGRPSAPGVRVSSRHVVTSSHQPTTLLCAVTGQPPPTLQWFHKSDECRGGRYRTLQDGSLHCLYIEDTCDGDEGEYTLRATNGQGEAEVAIDVTVLTPVPPEEDSSHAPIPVKDFPDLVSKLNRDPSKLMQEFYSIELPWKVSQHTGNLPINQRKNRYYNVLPYDHSRVILPLHSNIPGSDYINACHMNDQYISSQGPLPDTFEDFWRMVWDNNIRAIAMVTKLSDATSYHMKCHRYWPKKESIICGDFLIDLKEMKSFSTCEIRLLNVTKQFFRSPREICHFQFLSWPEYGVPKNATDLLDFRERVNDYKSKVEGPLLIHCSAGVGRTGTFLVLDILLNKLKKGASSIDVFNLVRGLRFRRERTVETHEQYLLIHEALAEIIRKGQYSVDI